MSDKTHNLVSLFEAALRIESPADRSDFLDQACGKDQSLRRQVERLLRSDERADNFLEVPAPGPRAMNPPDESGDNRAESPQAGLAREFGEDEAFVIGRAGHSVLKSLGQGIELTRVVLRESPAEVADPIVQPKSPQMPDRNSDSRYQLQGEIARGGIGSILKGRDTDLGRDLAIKVLLDEHKTNPEVIQRFVEEAQIGGQLQHPGIAPVYELGQFSDKRPFFSMKLVKGDALETAGGSRGARRRPR